jgi:predicted RNase H-like HicB family nuclease
MQEENLNPLQKNEMKKYPDKIKIEWDEWNITVEKDPMKKGFFGYGFDEKNQFIETKGETFEKLLEDLKDAILTAKGIFD